MIEADLDGDGVVTLEEWEAAGDALFDTLDRDGSGEITVAELAEGEAPLREDPAAPVELRRLERWSQRVDTDASGSLSRAEWQAERRRAFEAADRDRDRRLTSGPIDERSRIVLFRL